MKLADHGRLLWGAVAEFVFGVVIFIAVHILTDESTRDIFIRASASDWLAVTGQVLFPAAVAIWITYVNIESSQFGDYLRYRQAAGAFHFVFAYPGLVFFGATISLIFAKSTELAFMPGIAIFLLAYSVAVFLVMILNIATVMRLYGVFRVELLREGHRVAYKDSGQTEGESSRQPN